MSGRGGVGSSLGLTLLALAAGARESLGGPWRRSPIHRLLLAHPRPDGLGAHPRDNRPSDLAAGRRILEGVFDLAGETLTSGAGGDPFDRASPSRRFAEALHGFEWLRDLLALGDEGAAEGLRLVLGWRRTFGSWNEFAWSPAVLERRTYNLACASGEICVRASDAERTIIARALARHGRAVLGAEAADRGAERAVAAAVAGTALLGKAARTLRRAALTRLDRLLPETAPPMGGHASRNPQAALELLFDLQTLEDALIQHGLAASGEMLRAMDRLAAAVRFFTLADGRLAAFHGGEPLSPAYVAAAWAQDDIDERPTPLACNGYQRLEGRGLQVVADAAPPAVGRWSLGAAGQPLAVEITAGGRRLVTASAWSALAAAAPALRLVDAGSTAALGDEPCGAPLGGFRAQALGRRLVDGPRAVAALRQDTSGALLLEMSHEGWRGRFGLRYERRLYVDVETGELRGEDRFAPAGVPPGDGRRFIPFVVRFHLHPQVSALIARDRKSVLLKAEGEETGWRLRNDAAEVTLEPSLHHQDGRAWRSQQVVLRGQTRLDTGARVRWKLSADRVDAGAGPA